jgi:hypothetical protein
MHPSPSEGADVAPSRRRTSTRLASRVAVAALGLALCAPAAASAAAPSPRHCSPPGEQRSASVARADRADGTSEVTEFLGAGAYRVTRCGRDGGLLVSQTVMPIPDPDGGLTLVPIERQEPGATVSPLYGDASEPSWAAAFRADRAALRATIIPPTAIAATSQEPAAGTEPARPPQGARAARRRAPHGHMVKAAVAGNACDTTQYSFMGLPWTGRSYAYRINRGRFNYNDNTVVSIVYGHANWDRTYNSCGLSDITNLASWHLGSTSASVHTYADGASIVDKGSMSAIGCAGALACTWLFTNGATATETDQRYNEAITFSNVGAAGAYDYQAVATHESGHGVGLNHATSSDALTMYPTIGPGTTHARTLAKGDVLGLRARYP